MKNILLLMITLGLLCCVNKKTYNYTLKGSCERIIIQDTIGSKTIHFLISYHNESDKNIVIFSNTYNKKANKNNKYLDAGIFLKGLNVNTPIGQFHTSDKFYVNSGKTLKLLYSYSEQYPNQKIDFSSKDGIEKMLKRFTLNYHIVKDLVKMNNVYDAVPVSKDFTIDLSQTIIEFNKNLNIEDAIKLTEGKINR